MKVQPNKTYMDSSRNRTAGSRTAGSGLVPCIAKPVVWYAQKHTQRDDAIRAAYASGGFSMREVGEHFGLHDSVVSRVISRARNKTCPRISYLYDPVFDKSAPCGRRVMREYWSLGGQGQMKALGSGLVPKHWGQVLFRA